MTSDNIIQMPDSLDRIGQRIDVAYERAQHGHQEWIEGTLELAQALTDARDRFLNDDVGLNRWLVDNNHDHLGRTDRAAAINMGRYPKQARAVMNDFPSRSYRAIWDEMRVRGVSPNGDTPSVPPSLPESKPSMLPEPEKAKAPSPEKPSVRVPAPLPPVPIARSALAKLNPKIPTDDIQLIHQYMLSTDARKTLADVFKKKSGRPVLTMLLDAIRSGTFGPPVDSDIRTISIRLLLPWLDPRQNFSQQDISQPQLQKFIRDYVFPVLAENPALMTDPNGTAELNRLSMRRRADDENKARERLQGDQRKKAVQALPPTEQAVIAYGRPIWPPVGDIGLPYNYTELCHAIWYWRYFLDIARQDWRPKDIGMTVRHLTKYISPLQPGFHAAIREVSGAFEQQPDGECSFPMIPVNFGQ